VENISNFEAQSILTIITILTTMAVKYIPDELIAEIVNNGDGVQSFIREAIEEKLAAVNLED